MIKKVVQIGNRVLRKKAKKASDINSKKVKAIVKNLVDTMRKANLIGMASPQIGESLRIYITELRKTKLRKNQSKNEVDGLRVYINPVIIHRSNKEVVGYEGCGSIAEGTIFGLVKRPAEVEVEAHGIDGKKFNLKAKGLLARVIQHEHDHIDGIMFTDKSNPKTFLSKEEYLKKSKKKKK